MTTSDDTYSQVDGMQVHETDDGLVVFNPDTDKVHHLNFTAGAIYTLCEVEISGSDLRERFSALFSMDSAPAEKIEQCIEQLLNDGLLRTGSD